MEKHRGGKKKTIYAQNLAELLRWPWSQEMSKRHGETKKLKKEKKTK